MFRDCLVILVGIKNMRDKKVKFDIESFNSLPTSLKNNDYIDMLLFLIHLKPNVRLGKNYATAYNDMKKWCKKYSYKYIISSSGYMYISRQFVSAKMTQLVDDSLLEHSELLGMLLGYPKCCRKKIKEVGEQNIDEFENQLCSNGFNKPYHLINSCSYTKGYALISHVPCCNNCNESLKIARKALRVIRLYKEYPCMKRWVMFLK